MGNIISFRLLRIGYQASSYRTHDIFSMFCWSFISINLCNKCQLDALFILSLLRQSTATCFGHIYSPSSRGILYKYNSLYVLSCSVHCLLAEPTDSQLKTTTRTNLILVIDQINAQILVLQLVYCIPVHVSSTMCSSSGGQIVGYSIWYRHTL